MDGFQGSSRDTDAVVWDIAWNVRVCREATDGDVSAARDSLIADVTRAIAGLSACVCDPVVALEVRSHQGLRVDADSYEEAETKARLVIEKAFAEAGVAVDGLEMD